MPKRITILDPNGVEIASEREGKIQPGRLHDNRIWEDRVSCACDDLCDLLKRDNPKLGTYTVTVKEVGDD